MNLAIDGDRLQREIDGLSLISEQPPPVVTRVLFSEADLQARRLVKSMFGKAGLTVREDAAGNIFARWPGTDHSLPAIATGSHVDAIPNAGKYDGVVGVLGALEAVRSLQRAGFAPRRSIECIIFTAEEPTRFGLGCLGSRLLAGTLSPERIFALRDADGRELDFWRQRAGLSGDITTTKLSSKCYAGFVELHIEQGPILEQRNLSIGIVEKIAAPASLRLQLTGVGGHAGAVLMPERHDALLAGAEIALEVEKAALGSGSPDTVGTTGVFRIEPGAVNSVPCRATLEIDLRDTQLATRDAALHRIESAAADICRRRGIQLELHRVNMDAPALSDPALVRTISDVCQELDFSCLKMISRAYHDTLFMAQVCPVAMIFIPCRGGVSHRPDEYASPEQIRRGVSVLANTLAKLAG
jgi:N-carbamoyl-L-amino-acid hydrolase